MHALATLPRMLPAIRPAPGQASGKIEADNDPAAIASWLSQHARNPRTFANSRKEAERFYLWIESQYKTLADVRHEDIMRYRAFLADPPAAWVSKTPHPRLDPRWRPFRGPLSDASIRQAEIVLNGMFAWMVRADYIKANPLALSKRPRDTRTKTVSRFLTRPQLAAVFEAVDSLPEKTVAQRHMAARDRWLVRLIYLSGMRVSEATTHTMGAFTRRETSKGQRWALTITGKGGKERTIPATTAMLDALRAYRRAQDLPEWPVPGEETPLLPSLRGGKALTRTGAYHALAEILDAAAERCADPVDQKNLRRASTHWLRHSRGTHLVADKATLKTVQELLGHASLTTTSLYVHDELERMQDDIEQAEQSESRTP